MSEIMTKDGVYIEGTYGRFPVEIVNGKGCVFFDANGKRYIDMGTGIGVNAFGFCDEIWLKAVTEQLAKVQHTSNLYYNAPCAILAEKLTKLSGMEKVFFGNSGAEANECAIKTARKYAEDKKGKGHYHIITLKNSFHGRTVTTLAATGQDVFHQKFTPLTKGFLYAEANDIESVTALAEAYDVAGIMIECVQGEGGVVPLSEEFIRGVEALCNEKDYVFIVDEVQTGNGRTGKPYAFMHYGVHPDIVTTAKGLGGGLPIGACLFGKKTVGVLQKGDHGSTFGGNPVVCAGAITVIDRLTEDFMAEVTAKAEYIRKELTGADGIIGITGKGLMIGIQTEKPAKEVVDACLEHGIACLTAKTKVRLLPALNIPYDVLAEALSVIKAVCAK